MVKSQRKFQKPSLVKIIVCLIKGYLEMWTLMLPSHSIYLPCVLALIGWFWLLTCFLDKLSPTWYGDVWLQPLQQHSWDNRILKWAREGQNALIRQMLKEHTLGDGEQAGFTWYSRLAPTTERSACLCLGGGIEDRHHHRQPYRLLEGTMFFNPWERSSMHTPG